MQPLRRLQDHRPDCGLRLSEVDVSVVVREVGNDVGLAHGRLLAKSSVSCAVVVGIGGRRASVSLILATGRYAIVSEA
jgi:hypothetical protein